MTSSPTDQAGVVVDDVRIADVGEAYLVAPIGGGRGAAVLFLHWFATEEPDGNRTQFRDEAIDLSRRHGVVDFGAMHGTILAAEDARISAVVLIAGTPRWGDWFLAY